MSIFHRRKRGTIALTSDDSAQDFLSRGANDIRN
jgi:hypothetical protein